MHSVAVPAVSSASGSARLRLRSASHDNANKVSEPTLRRACLVARCLAELCGGTLPRESMATGAAASRPAARPAGTRYLETVFRSWFSENAAATRKPHAPVRNAKGNGMSIGWIGCDVIEAVLFIHTMRASREPARAGGPELSALRTR